MTDNKILIKAAKRNEGKFKVAVCNVPGTKRKRYFTNEDKADLDIRTSNNLIGDIINLAQEITTDIWDKLYHGSTFNDVSDLYLETCKLSILSGLEIDKAKKEFVIDAAKEISKIRALRKTHQIDDKNVKPKFFAHIAKQKGYYNPQRKVYVNHHTAMDYLQQCVNSFRIKKNGMPKKIDFLEFSDIIFQENFRYKNVNDTQISNVLKSVDNLNLQISAIYNDQSTSKSEKHIVVASLRQEFIESLGTQKFNNDTMVALLQTIEKKENQKYRRLLFYTLFGYPNTSFYSIIKQSRSVLDVIMKDPSADDIAIFGETFAKKHTKIA